MHFVFFDAPSARDQLDDTANIAADVGNIGGGKSVLQIAADVLFIAQTNDLKIIVASSLEIMLCTWRRTVQIIL